LRIKHFQHRAAGTRTDDNGVGIRELREHLGGDGARFVQITGIERRLAAASNCFWHDDAVAEAFEDLHHADARARKQRVDETRNEQRDGHVGFSANPLFTRRGKVSANFLQDKWVDGWMDEWPARAVFQNPLIQPSIYPFRLCWLKTSLLRKRLHVNPFRPLAKKIHL
jgi:hypothetical protein